MAKTENTYKVIGTAARHRRNIDNDYIIVMNSEVKMRHGIGRYAVVQTLFENSKRTDKQELRCMVVFGKVVVDDSLDGRTIAVDQTLRNALGAEFNKRSDKEVKLYPLERTFAQRAMALLRPGQFLCLRVNYPSLNDMEKKLCRISSNSRKLLNSNDGNSVWVECCRSAFRKDIFWLVNEILYERNEKNYRDNISMIDRYFGGITLPDSLYSDMPELRGCLEHKDAEYIKALAEVVFAPENKSDEVSSEIKRVLHNITAYGEWEDEGGYKLVDQKICAYEYDLESEKSIKEFQDKEKDKCLSMEYKYPNSDEIFNMQPDLETIRLDKFYRDELSLNILDSVKVKRRFLESFRDDAIEYGLIFVLTVFAAVAAITPENLHLLLFAIPLSVLITFILVLFRNK